MNCLEFQKKLIDFFEQNYKDKKCKAILKHIEICEKCRELYESYKKIIDCARLLRLNSLPEDCKEILYENLKKKLNIDFEI